MCHRGFMGFLSSVALLVTGLVSLNAGLSALGVFNFFLMSFFLMNPSLMMYTQLFVGLCGAWTLICWVKHLFYCNGKC